MLWVETEDGRFYVCSALPSIESGTTGMRFFFCKENGCAVPLSGHNCGAEEAATRVIQAMHDCGMNVNGKPFKAAYGKRLTDLECLGLLESRKRIGHGH